MTDLFGDQSGFPRAHEVTRIRAEHLLFPEPVTAGMNILVIAELTSLMRRTNEDPPPIEVTPLGPHYRIADGRHRTVAAMMAGRKDVLAKIMEPK